MASVADGGGDVGQGRLRIAEDADLRRIVLADLPGVGVDMNELQARRNRLDLGRQRPGEHVAADREQQVVAVEHLADALLRAGHRTAIERMRGGERRGVRHELGVDRRTDQFRQCGELLVRAALRHGIAGDDDGALGLGQQIGGGVDRVDVAAHARRDAGRLLQIDVGVVLENVAGQRQEHRAGRRRQRSLRRAMHERRQILEPIDLG